MWKIKPQILLIWINFITTIKGYRWNSIFNRTFNNYFGTKQVNTFGTDIYYALKIFIILYIRPVFLRLHEFSCRYHQKSVTITLRHDNVLFVQDIWYKYTAQSECDYLKNNDNDLLQYLRWLTTHWTSMNNGLRFLK